MQKLIILCTIVLTSWQAQAATWYGFCWGKNGTGPTFCSPVEEKGVSFSQHCKTWAKSNGGNKWGNYTATSISSLESKQDIKCDSIIGGGGAPATSWQCYVERLCSETDTSSMSLDPLGNSVNAVTEEVAIEKCAQTNKMSLLSELTSNSKANCHTRIHVQL